MPKRARKLTCKEFQNLLPEFIASGADIEDYPHVKACAIYGQLAQELEAIAEEARKRLPPEWSGVTWWPR